MAFLTYKKVTDSVTRTITFLDSMNLSASSFYCKTVKIARKSGIMRDVLLYFLLNNTASYSKESSVDKLYVFNFAICNSKTKLPSYSPTIFLTSRENISPLSSPNLFARRQAFAAIRRRTQWINRKINGKENKNGADAPAIKEFIQSMHSLIQ